MDAHKNGTKLLLLLLLLLLFLNCALTIPPLKTKQKSPATFFKNPPMFISFYSSIMVGLYSNREYWNERYKCEMEPYEWYQSYAGISHLLTPDILSGLHHGMDPAQPQRRMLEPFMMMTMNHSKHHHHHHNNDATATNLQQQQQQQRAQARVLNIGCGSSRLSEDMLRDGWTGGIVNVDFSNVVIDQLKAKYNDAYYKNNNIHIPHSELRKEEPMTFVCANVNEGLPFADGSFDLIVCKASLDAILQQQNNARHMMAECHRLLKDNATTTVTTVSTTSTTSTLLLTPTMICITHGNPESRLVHFENPRDEWWDNVGIFALANNNNNNKHVHAHQGSKCHYAYVCKKRTIKTAKHGAPLEK